MRTPKSRSTNRPGASREIRAQRQTSSFDPFCSLDDIRDRSVATSEICCSVVFRAEPVLVPRGNISSTPRRSIPALPECQAEGLRPHTLGGLGSCLFRRRPAATPKRRRQLSDALGHLPPWPSTRPADRSAALLLEIPNCAA